MKAVILAGGYGTRLSEETGTIPKPLVEIGGRPILWHIMKIYESGGITDFVICCGYKGDMIKRYFTEYGYANADFTVDLAANRIEINRSAREPWRVTLVDTGQDTMTGGRIRRVRDHLDNDTFCLTYGDGVADIDIPAAIAFHRAQGTEATVTAVQQPGRFGALNLADGNKVASFREKSMLDGPMINGGFFVLEPAVLDRIDGDDTVFEDAPLRSLVEDGQLSVYRHDGFWQNMDTLRDKHVLQGLWSDGRAPWRVWA
ncbi:MAG: glucose-1-phosphate cytidylyltransferase [Rhodobacteraceae bacterium PARR1]|nr:MAG: glucose-1-phosphate cytidylyltransferase [Rhodobacteraceae bacterium PARR1]